MTTVKRARAKPASCGGGTSATRHRRKSNVQQDRSAQQDRFGKLIAQPYRSAAPQSFGAVFVPRRQLLPFRDLCLQPRAVSAALAKGPCPPVSSATTAQFAKVASQMKSASEGVGVLGRARKIRSPATHSRHVFRVSTVEPPVYALLHRPVCYNNPMLFACSGRCRAVHFLTIFHKSHAKS